MQLVLINSRIVAHGEGFLAMGGVVINTETGKKYEHATIAECSGCPSDIDAVGYEYHAGTFVPCAPYGIGDGNVAVVCNEDCKSIKDSGIPFADIYNRVITGTYTGEFQTVGGSSTTYGDTTIPMPGKVKLMFIFSKQNNVLGIINGVTGLVFEYRIGTANNGTPYGVATASAKVSDTNITITVPYKATPADMLSYLSVHGVTYNYVAFL